MSISAEILQARRAVAEQKLAEMRARAKAAANKATAVFASGRLNAWVATDAIWLAGEADAYERAIKDIFDPLMLVVE